MLNEKSFGILYIMDLIVKYQTSGKDIIYQRKRGKNGSLLELEKHLKSNY